MASFRDARPDVVAQPSLSSSFGPSAVDGMASFVTLPYSNDTFNTYGIVVNASAVINGKPTYQHQRDAGNWIDGGFRQAPNGHLSQQVRQQRFTNNQTQTIGATAAVADLNPWSSNFGSCAQPQRNRQRRGRVR